jgi:hypothetical protein
LLGIYIVSEGTIGVATESGHVERKAARKAVRELLILSTIRQIQAPKPEISGRGGV